MKTVVIVPTYNEVDNIEKLITEILKLDPGYTVVVVDDNSPDGTARVVNSIASREQRVILVSRPAKLGLGTAYIAGFNRMLQDAGARFFITMDADFSHNPRFIPDLVDAMDGVDIAIGSRYITAGKTVDFAGHRKIISRCANLLAKTLLGSTPLDCTSGFRCYDRRVLETVPVNTFVSKGYSFLVEMLFQCQRMGFKVREAPICYVARAHGMSKISMQEIRYTAWTIVRLWFKWRMLKIKVNSSIH